VKISEIICDAASR